MLKKKRSVSLGLFFILSIWIWINNVYALDQNQNLGATIQISTQLRSFLGQPSWLIVIRDLDHNQNIPFLYDIKKGENYWLALTAGHNYLILASTLRIHSHGTQQNRYKQYTINNFCGIESHGNIIRHQSLYIRLSGDLTAERETVQCTVSRFTHVGF